MTILLNKPYLVKVTTKGEEGQKYPKIWPRGLWMTPISRLVYVVNCRLLCKPARRIKMNLAIWTLWMQNVWKISFSPIPGFHEK